MIWTTPRKARKIHHCGTGDDLIRPGDRYLSHVASPHHDLVTDERWSRMAECMMCAARYGRAS